jgi:hypothetical protein
MGGCGRQLPRGVVGFCERCGPHRPRRRKPEPGRIVRRIGRIPTPAEDVLRQALEDEHVLDLHARLMMPGAQAIDDEARRRRWLELEPHMREHFRHRAIAQLRDRVPRA